MESNLRISKLETSFREPRMPGYLLPPIDTEENSMHFLRSKEGLGTAGGRGSLLGCRCEWAHFHKAVRGQ